METTLPLSYASLKSLSIGEALSAHRALCSNHVADLKETLDWEELFGNRCPVCIEYCSGNGHWIIEQALAHPAKNWVAIEWQWARAARILTKRDRANLKNILVICADAREVTRQAIPTASIEGIWVHFPDPWPKRRHAKHRLLTWDVSMEWHRVLQANKRVTVVTDHADSIHHLVHHGMDSAWWVPQYAFPYYQTQSSYDYSTFGELWQRQSRALFLTQWTKRQQGIPRIGTIHENVRYVTLDCGIRSSLKWQIPVGLPVLWHLDGGYLEDEGEIRSFEMAIDEWVSTVWPRHETVGVVLYRGCLPIPMYLLRSLAARLPDGVDPFIMVDLSDHSGSSGLRSLQREEMVGFRWIIKGLDAPYAFPFIGWNQDSPYGVCEKGEIMPTRVVRVALCYGKEVDWDLPAFPCRCIPEALLTEEWEQLDLIIAIQPSLQTRRALAGFVAAGGEVWIDPSPETLQDRLQVLEMLQ